MNTSSSLVSLLLIPLLTVWPVRAAVVDTPTAAAVLEVKANATPSNKGFTVQVTDDASLGVADAAVLVRLPNAGSTGTFPDGTHTAIGYTDANGTAEISGIQWNAAKGSVAVTIMVSKGDAHAGLLLEQSLDVAPSPATPAPVAPAPVAPTAVATAVSKPESNDVPAAQTASVAPAPPGIPQAAPLAQPRMTPPNSSPSDAPSISIVSDNSHEKFTEGGSSHKKWYILAAIVAAGAGAGVALMGKKSSSSSSSSSSSGVSIGTPTVSIGAP